MLHFNEKEQKLLRALFDTLVPKVLDKNRHPQDFWQRKGSEWVQPEDIAEALEATSPGTQQEFKQLMQVMSSRSLGFTWKGPFKSFVQLSPKQRAALLAEWSQHRINLFRKGFASLKKLILFLYYTKPERNHNPNWSAIGYPGPMQELEPPTREYLETVVPRPNGEHLKCDVLVIGSGAGGGVVAAELAAAGKEVIVVEKGAYLDRPDFNQLEAEMMGMYEAKGALTTEDGGVTVFAGSCLGGGTTINWAGSFHTPDAILLEWAQEHQCDMFTSQAMQESLRAVAERMGVNTDFPYHNQQNQALLQGSKALGQNPTLIPRNEVGLKKKDFQGIGFSTYGDRYGHKQGTLQTYLRDAVRNGARILPYTKIEKVLVENGRAIGAEGEWNVNGQKVPVSIMADKVVVAAGALHTPVLLKKSGLGHRHIGQHLYFHPTVAVSGLYPKVADPPWTGPMMSVVNNHFTQLHGNYGFKLETPPTHAGLSVLALPWITGESHKRAMLKLPRYGHFIVLTRDKCGGSVSVDRHGFPRIKYKLDDFDQHHMLRGIHEAARIHEAAGAEELLFPHNTERKLLLKGEPNELAEYLKDLPDWGWKPNQFPLFSAHQMGTARMGGVDRDHPVKPNGETREVKGLYVADASLFPASSGVNPMLTIMGLAHRVAQGMKD